MEVLFYFLNWTASFSHIDEESGSKMDAHNLATVITPNILYIKQKEGGGESGDAYFLSIESVNILIEEQGRFAEVPPEVLMVMQQTSLPSVNQDVTSKEIITRIEQFLKEVGGVEALSVSVPTNDGSTTNGVVNGNGEWMAAAGPIRVDTNYVPSSVQQASIKRVNSGGESLSPSTPTM
jgi:hypothetical protein